MEVTQKPFARKKPDQLVYLELGSGNGGMLLSISEDGFRFRAVSAVRANGLMPFAFSFDGNQRLQGIGEVEWLEEDGKSGGMRFVEVTPDFRSALEQWLALDATRGRSGREATPAAATPLDTMEKIREELRRGYPEAAAKVFEHGQSQETPRELSRPEPEAPLRKSPPETRPQPSNPVRDGREPAAARNRVAEPPREKEIQKDLRDAPGAPLAERNRRSQPPGQEEASGENLRRERPQPFYPPPFRHSAEPEPDAATGKAGSAFIKKPAPSPPPEDQTPSLASGPSQPALPAAPPASEPARAREEAHAAAETLRRPFRGEPRPSYSERPYVPPPVDESFESAWERAKLTAPPESPHLSRAAAGSIIGIALAVILGALAFNFRQDIGELVIDLGQKISGGNPPAAATAAAETKPESESAAVPSSASPDKPAAGLESAATPNTGSHQPETRPADSRASEANPVTERHTGASNPPSTVPAANGNDNAASGGVAASAPPPAGSQPSAIGTEPGNGQEEFNAAREMLKGDHRHRDLSRAVDLLWAGVRKGYVPAEVTLADLYRRGDGVEKNCDQAQVLLVAASKKGSPEARQLLELMAEQGCTD